MALILGLSRSQKAFGYGFGNLSSLIHRCVKAIDHCVNPAYPVVPPAIAANIASLPAELKLQILRSLDDVPSLRNLCLASQTFQQISDRNLSLLKEIICREFGKDNFFEAYLVVRTATLRALSSEQPDAFKAFLELRNELRSKDVVLATVTVQEARRICQLLDHVRYFVADYAKSTINVSLGTVIKTTGDSRQSPFEMKRITRAFLRTELYCCLFDCGQSLISYDDKNDQTYQFLRAYPAWELEELVCIRDYLISRVTPSFQVVQSEYSKDPLAFVIMDPWDSEDTLEAPPQGLKYIPDDCVPEWFNPCYDGGVNLEESTCIKQQRNLKMVKNRQIAKGLAHLFQLFNSQTPAETVHIFERAFSLRSYNGNEWSIFDRDRSAIHRLLEEDRATAEAFLHEDPEEFEGEEFGPNSGWLWAHNNKVYPLFNESSKIRERRWGYVMWDKQRLDSWNIFESAPPQKHGSWLIKRHIDATDDCERMQIEPSLNTGLIPDTRETVSSVIKNSPESSELVGEHGSNLPIADICGSTQEEQQQQQQQQQQRQRPTELILDTSELEEPSPTVEHTISSQVDCHVDLSPSNTNDAEQVVQQDCVPTQCPVRTTVTATEDQQALEDYDSTSSKSVSPYSIFSNFSGVLNSPPSSDSDLDSPKAAWLQGAFFGINFEFVPKKQPLAGRRIKPMRQRRVRKPDNLDEDSCCEQASNEEITPSPTTIDHSVPTSAVIEVDSQKESKGIEKDHDDQSVPTSAVIEVLPQKGISETVKDHGVDCTEQVFTKKEIKVVKIEATKYTVEELAAWIQGKPLPNKPKAGKWSKKNKKKKSKKAQVA